MNRAIIDIIYIGHVEHLDLPKRLCIRIGHYGAIQMLYYYYYYYYYYDNDMSRVTVARTCTNQVRGRRSDRRSVSPVQQLERLDVS